MMPKDYARFALMHDRAFWYFGDRHRLTVTAHMPSFTSFRCRRNITGYWRKYVNILPGTYSGHNGRQCKAFTIILSLDIIGTGWILRFRNAVITGIYDAVTLSFWFIIWCRRVYLLVISNGIRLSSYAEPWNSSHFIPQGASTMLRLCWGYYFMMRYLLASHSLSIFHYLATATLYLRRRQPSYLPHGFSTTSSPDFELRQCQSSKFHALQHASR